MKLPHLNITDEYIEIPKKFHSFLEEGPFKRCVVCEKYLLSGGTQYVIEKAFIKSEVKFEYALCLVCLDQFRNAYSEQSKAVIESYFNEKIDLQKRRKNLLDAKGTNINSWISDCLFTSKSFPRVKEYQIYAHCFDGYLLFTYLPFMICSDVLGEIYQKLSSETKDESGRFTRDYLNKMPDLNVSPSQPQLVLV